MNDTPAVQPVPHDQDKPQQKLTSAAAIKEFMMRVVPWPTTNDEPGYVNLHWHVLNAPFRGRGFRSIDELCEAASALAQGKRSNLYFCLSRQAIAAERRQKDALAFRSIWLDLDVKEKGYPTVEDAIDALFAFIEHYRLPPPSAVVVSGSGLHVYWFSTRPLSFAEWRPYAEGLKAAALQWGLKCDAGVIADAARVLRVPGTRNFKTNPPKPVYLIQLRDEDIDFAAGLKVLSDLAPTPRTNGAGVPKELKIADALKHLSPRTHLAGGIVLNDTPLLPVEPILEGCAWLRKAHETGGKAFDNPQWNLTTLCAVFLIDGNKLAHEFGNQHPDYDFQETEKEWERKNREHETKGVGWPSCKAISDNGGKPHCESCPHFSKGKSPLNLALQQQPAETPPAPTDWGDPTELKVSFANIPHRQWLYGTYLIRGEVTVIAAPGGVGKTALTTGIATEVSTGIELLEEKIWGADLKVLSINGEDGTAEINRRMWAFTRAHAHLLGEQAPDRLYVVGADDARIQRMSFLQTVKNISLLDLSGFAALEFALEAIRPDVLMLDPLVAFCGGGNMNDNSAMSQVMRALKLLAAKFNCAVLIVHHTRKGGERGDQETVSGAAAIVNLARRTLMPVPMTAQEATEFGLPPSKRSPYFKLVDAKANFTPRSEESPWYRLHSVQLPNAEPPLYPHGDNVQAVVRETLPLTKTPAEAADDRKVQRAILDLVNCGKLTKGKLYPYSPNVSGAKNTRALLDDAVTAVAAATAPKQWLPGDLRAVVHAAINKMKNDRWLYEKKMKSGPFRQALGLYVEWRDTPWPNRASPASDGSAAEGAEDGDEISDDELDPEREEMEQTPGK